MKAANSPRTLPFVCIVILNYNGAELTINCVNSVLRIDYPNFRIIVVDNASVDDSVARFKVELTDPRVELLLNSRNEGYAGGNNRGIEKALSAGAEYVLVLNNDTLVNPGFLTPLVDAMEKDPRIGICGGPIFSTSDAPPACGEYVNLYSAVTKTGKRRPVGDIAQADYLCGVHLLMRSEMLHKTGGFDESFFLLYEETDLCFRARKDGFQTCFVPSPGLVHLGHASLNKYPARMLYFFVRNRAWFIRRHGTRMQRVSFTLFSVCRFYPRIILGRIAKRDMTSLMAVLKGIWEGHTRALLAINRGGRLRIDNPGSDPVTCSSS